MKAIPIILNSLAIIVLILTSWNHNQAHTTPIPAPQTPVEQRTAEIWRITAYCPCEKCCGRFSDGITASGVKAEGLIIAAPKDIPFGTQMYIEGYGWGIVQDRGGAIKGKRLDLLFSTHNLALNWGVKYYEKIGNSLTPKTK